MCSEKKDQISRESKNGANSSNNNTKKSNSKTINNRRFSKIGAAEALDNSIFDYLARTNKQRE